MSKYFAWIAFGVAAVVGFWAVNTYMSEPVAPTTTIPTTVSLRGKTMGSTYSVRYVPGHSPPPGDPSGLSPLEVQSAIEEELQTIDEQLSTWNPDSQISQFNASRSTQWFELAPETIRLIEESKELSRWSDGKFDLTIAPLVRLWGFGAQRGDGQLPDESKVQSALAHVGIDKLELRPSPPAARKSDPEIEIELSAVGAGEAADRVSEVLQKLGFNDHFIDIAGEIVTRGRRADGTRWQVGIERPIAGPREIMGSLQLENAAVATSGNYRNSVQVAGQRIGHTLDATTGRPAQNDVLSATVVADRCSRADGLATMLMTLSADEGLALAETHGWSVLLVVGSEEQMAQRISSRLESSGMYRSSR